MNNQAGEQDSQQSVADKMRAELSSIPGVSPEEVASTLQSMGVNPTEDPEPTPTITAEEVAKLTPETAVTPETVTATPAATEKPANVPLADLPGEKPAEPNPIADLLNLNNTQPPVYENFEQVSKEVSSILGSEVKDFGDVIKIAQQASESKKQVELLSVEVTKGEQFKEIFATLPDPVFALVEACALGTYDESKLAELTGTIIDYNRPFENQDKKKIIGKYAPHLLEDDLYFEDEDRVEKDLKTIKSVFDKDKKEFEGTIEPRRKNIEAAENSYRESAQSAMSNLNTVEYFKFGVPEKTRISQIMEKGQNGILSLYFNEDGSYKKEAAELVALNLFGRDSIKYQRDLLTKQIKSKVETEVNTQILSRGNDTPPASNTGALVTGTPDEAILADIESMLPKTKPGIYS